MPDIVIAEFMDEVAVARLTARYSTLYDPGLVDAPERLKAELAEARALIVRNRTQVTEALIAEADGLECVGRLGVGLDNIDTKACKRRGIAVYPATGANDLSVAEYVVTCTLVLLRGAYADAASVAAGDWPRQALMSGREMSGKVLGLVGFGAIARATATRARALGMEIVAFDPHIPATSKAWNEARRAELPALLAEADVVSLHVPLTGETRHLLGREAISKMKAGAILINAARGGVVDEEALAEALEAGQLSGAALDVFENEPLTAAAGARFAGLPNVILTPHIAGLTVESNTRVSGVTADKVLAHLEGAR
ncbi:NAD(P)-dependent oxidoreductase [Afifella sp. IM 167]|uniref:NAD(P)-dependent oxidoreductase n=1 Tax=Afifella sp. IM 167 TaxID=2033586 RepID=UPI001CCAAAA0|nr:NAD(P)-dependent oxidoreductase [Afifella sp. IM 167]MBZ8133846.1 3-phosphoglycerate dehydrogenase [Afifella sp. IM 167]